MITKTQAAAEFANQVLQSRLVAAVQTIHNAEASERIAANQMGRVEQIAEVAAKAYTKRTGEPATPKEMAVIICQQIADASEEQSRIDRRIEREISG